MKTSQIKLTIAISSIIIITAIISSLMLSTSNVQNPEVNTDLVPIEIELPKVVLGGTPENVYIENLEKPSTSPRPPFLAPAGTTNVALNKPVTSSDQWILLGNVGMVTDGDKEGDNIVELSFGRQYVTIDLEGLYSIYAIVIWHFHSMPRSYNDVIVQTSNDKYFIENVHTIFNNDIDNSSGLGVGTDKNYIETNEGKLLDAKGIEGRYVRLYSNGCASTDMNHYIEVEVYGKSITQ